MSPAPPLPDRYADLEPLGSGGMADVYRARDTALGRLVAIKVLRSGGVNDAEMRKRFEREGRAAASVSHPNVVAIHDVGAQGDFAFIVMEFMAGGSLAERVAAGPLAPAQAVEWIRQAAAGLDAAHGEGIVHRDVKPANLLLDLRGALKVADFGIVRISSGTDSTLTQAGALIGTYGYLSPEQMRGEPGTVVSDVYSLGVVAYEMLTGFRPFGDRVTAAEVAAGLYEDAPPPSARRAGLSPQLDDALLRALAKQPELRPRTAGELADQIAGAVAAPTIAGAVSLAVPPTRIVAPPQTTRATMRSRRFPKRRALVGVGVVAGLSVVGGGAAAAALLIGGSEDPPPPTSEIVVPALGGARVDDARTLVRRAATGDGADAPRLVVSGRRFSEQRLEGRVISQMPTPGASVMPGGTVAIVVSLGTAFAPVPAVVGENAGMARTELREAGFRAQVDEESSFTVPLGVVLASDPGPGERGERPGPVALTVSSGPRADAITIFADTTIGSFPVRPGESGGGRLGQAVTAFGQPTSRTLDGSVGCNVAWSELGLAGYFYSLGGGDPCLDDIGAFGSIEITGPRFVTDRGIAIGSSESDLLDRYPEAISRGSEYGLAQVFLPFGEGGFTDSLVAVVSQGEVQRIEVRYPAGGD